MTMTYTVIGNPAVHPEPGGPLDNLSWDDPPDPAALGHQAVPRAEVHRREHPDHHGLGVHRADADGAGEPLLRLGHRHQLIRVPAGRRMAPGSPRLPETFR